MRQSLNHTSGSAGSHHSAGRFFLAGIIFLYSCAAAPQARTVSDPSPAPIQTAESPENLTGRGVEFFQQKNYSEAVPLFRRAAEQGYAEAQSKLGFCYYFGHGLPQDYAQAVKWYERAAGQGLAKAQLNLALCHYQGLGVDRNFAEAAKWFRQAASQGLAAAQNSLGICLLAGEGIPRNDPEAIGWFRKAALQGLAEAQYHLGTCLWDGRGTARDTKEALDWLGKAAAQNWPAAQNSLGSIYLLGQTVGQNTQLAVHLFQQAASQGFAKAQHNLGVCHASGQGVEKNLTNALHWYRLAAEQKHADSEYNLAVAYWDGQGMPSDHPAGLLWFQRAADHGSAEAQMWLGRYHAQAEPSPRWSEAMGWYRKAAEQGLASAQFEVGLAHAQGRTGVTNMAEAVSWLRRAARQQDRDAQSELGALLLRYPSHATNASEAVFWLKPAAEWGSPEAQARLGECFEQGMGVPVDKVAALHWYLQAASVADETAVAGRDRLLQELTESQIKQARKPVAKGLPVNAPVPQSVLQESVPWAAWRQAPAAPSTNDLPGRLIFHGRYQHQGRGGMISELWIKQLADGSRLALASLPASGLTELVAGTPDHRVAFHGLWGNPPAGRPGFHAALEIRGDSARLWRKGIRQDQDGKELKLPPGQWFDPNTRPDTYATANILLLAFSPPPRESREFAVYDWDNAGEALVSYGLKVLRSGRETVHVPAGDFSAERVTITQTATADTWFKKRAGHITEFWVVEGNLIVRILRHREPYELVLLDYDFPERLADSAAMPAPVPAIEPKADPTNYAADVEFLLLELEQQAGHFFPLKGIDWPKVAAQFRREVHEVKTDAGHLQLCQRLVARLCDAHAAFLEVKIPAPDESRGKKRSGPNLHLLAADQQVFIRQAYAPARQLGVRIGQEVCRIDGLPALEWISHRMELMREDQGYSTSHQARYAACHWGLAGDEGSLLSLELRREDGLQIVQIPRRGGANYIPDGPLFPPQPSLRIGRQSYGKTPGGMGYIHLRDIPGNLPEQLDTMLEGLGGPPGLILDLRANGGGGCDHPAVFGRFIPAGQNWRQYRSAGPHPFSGPLVVIVDSGTRSAGETVAGMLKEDGRAYLIGDGTTAGTSSLKTEISPPSSLFKVRFSVASNMQRLNQGRGIEGLGIPPHELIPYDQRDLLAGRDTQILRAETLLQNGFPPGKVPFRPDR